MNKISKTTAIVIGVLAACVVLMIADVQLRYIWRIQHWSVSHLTERDTSMIAIVLGASVTARQTPSDALRDRLEEGIWLYETGLAGKILITGDDGRNEVDEISVMKKYLLEHGVQEKDVLIDPEGYRTYESCKRAHEVFHLEKAIVVTQRFHLARALYLCNRLGVDSIGSPSDRSRYAKINYFWLRDLAASAKAWWDVNVQAPKSPIKN
ncbi:hypothetical protein EXS71_03095 [Candidatus Uhrbacteria bacterium]|nr:hypothetical protein [Candidatus Uhrbacteria bacterium]